jgi:hypothetical protein
MTALRPITRGRLTLCPESAWPDDGVMRDIVRSLTREQCLTRLSSQRVGRVSASKDALPFIAPVTYRNDGVNIVFRAALGAGLAELCDRAVIAFETDDIAATPDGGWSVHLVGVADRLEQGGAEDGQSVRVSIDRISGQQVEVASLTAKAG